MAQPFLGEVRIFSFNFAPKGWAQCNGQLMPINQNQALFSLFGTMYGGDGRVTFGLPNLRDRAPIHVGQGYTQGQGGGEAAHTLIVPEIPMHTHQWMGSSTTAAQVSPTNNVLGLNAVDDIFLATASPAISMNLAEVANAGNSQPHNNLQPFLTLNFCVALVGIFPSRN